MSADNTDDKWNDLIVCRITEKKCISLVKSWMSVTYECCHQWSYDENRFVTQHICLWLTAQSADSIISSDNEQNFWTDKMYESDNHSS